MNLLFKINLVVEAEDISEPELRDKVEEGLNMACTYLEDNLKHESISYKIKETVDLD